MQLSQPTFAAVVGPGRVGRALAAMCSPPPPLLGRKDVIPEHLQGPILVCCTNDALEDVVQAAPQPKRADLVFTQNGMLLPWLRRHELQANTQVLLYMSASDDGVVVDGGLTCAAGCWAPAVQAVLLQGGVQCEVVDWRSYRQRMIVKLLWSSIFWMMSAALGGAKVGRVAESHGSEVEALVQEMLPIAVHYMTEVQGNASCNTDTDQHEAGRHSGAVAVGSAASSSAEDVAAEKEHTASLPLTAQAVCQALLQYSLAISNAVPSAAMAQQEFEWRNGFFLRHRAQMGAQSVAAGTHNVQSMQLHVAWLQRAGCPAHLIHTAEWGSSTQL